MSYLEGAACVFRDDPWDSRAPPLTHWAADGRLPRSMPRSHTEALAETRGGGRKCPPAIAELLKLGVDDWSPSDMPVEVTSQKDVETLMDVWVLVFEQIGQAKKGIDEIDKLVTKAEMGLFRLWVTAAVDVPVPDAKDVDVTDPAPDKTETEEEKAKTEAELKEKEKKKPTTPLSTTAMEDMRAQKAKKIGQLAYTNAALFLGTAPSRAELAGLGYGDYPTASEVIRKLSKGNAANSTMPDAMKLCRASKSLVPLDAFMSQLCDALNGAPDDYDGYAPVAAVRIAQWFSKIKDAADDDLSVVEYVDQYYRTRYKGRGLPVLEPDMALMVRARKLAQTAPGGVVPVQPKGGTLPNDELKAITEQLSSLVETVREASSAIGSIKGDITRLQSRCEGLNTKVDRMSSANINPDKNMTCSKCGEKGHRAANCPNKST